MNEYLKEWKQKNPNYFKEYYIKNKTTLRAYHNEYVNNHKEKIKEYQRQYQKEYYKMNKLSKSKSKQKCIEKQLKLQHQKSEEFKQSLQL